MYSLKNHIQEPLTEAATQNLHLEHIEDVILNDGLAGAHVALNFIDGIRNSLEGHGTKHLSVTTKWDGSPAIVAGTHPETGRYFIGTKSVFNKSNPKIIYSKDDIKRYYKDSPALAKHLEQVFDHLQKIDITGVLQGDLMFSSGEVSSQNIDGTDYVTFKPNTIMYAVPSDSELAERIRRAKIGIIFHTSYTGDTLKGMSPSYKVNIQDLKSSPDVWVDDANYRDETGTATLTQDEHNTLTNHQNSAERALAKLNPIRFEQLLTSKQLLGFIKMYTNNEVRNGKLFDRGFMDGLTKFIETRIDQENIRDPAKEKKKQTYSALLNRLGSTIAEVVQFQSHMNEAKLLLIKKLQQIESVGTFVSSGDGGYKATKQEGFVAVDHLTNKAIKLVDRLDFSKKNFKRNA